jgi:hypothetical protein
VYVFNRGADPVMLFNRTGKFLESWGAGCFERPHGRRRRNRWRKRSRRQHPEKRSGVLHCDPVDHARQDPRRIFEPDKICAREEVFAPMAYVMTFRTKDETALLGNRGSDGLADSRRSRDVDRANRGRWADTAFRSTPP